MPWGQVCVFLCVCVGEREKERKKLLIASEWRNWGLGFRREREICISLYTPWKLLNVALCACIQKINIKNNAVNDG